MKNIAFGLRVGIAPPLVRKTGAFRVVSEDLSVIPLPHLHSVCTGQDDSVHINILFEGYNKEKGHGPEGCWLWCLAAGKGSWAGCTDACSASPQSSHGHVGLSLAMKTGAQPSGLQDIHDFYHDMDLHVSEAE